MLLDLSGDERVKPDDVDADVQEDVHDESGDGALALAVHRARQERLEEDRVSHADEEDGVERQRHHRV